MDVKSFILGLQVGSQSAGGGGGSTEDMISYDDMAIGTTADVITLKNATEVKAYAFYGRTMKEISMPNVTTVNGRAFGYCSLLTNPGFSEGLTTIGTYAYMYCQSLTSVTLPSTLSVIDQYAFQNSTKLRTVTFKSKPSSLHAKALAGCSALTTINCPWAEGEVADAPWGATKATIVYNYTGG